MNKYIRQIKLHCKCLTIVLLDLLSSFPLNVVFLLEQILQFTDRFVSCLWYEEVGEDGAKDAADSGHEEDST